MSTLSGRLSLAELQTVLPWLVRQEGAASNGRFWRQVGDLMSLSDLEQVKSSLGDVDLTPLVEANIDFWEARWAYMGLSTPVEVDETYEQRRNFWSFLRGSLGIDLGGTRISVATDGRLFPKGRGGRSAIAWDRVKPALEGERLSSVDLHGIRRSISISAEQTPDVRTDVEEVTQSLDDTYSISQVTVRVAGLPEHDGEADIRVDFTSGITQSRGGVSIQDLYRITTQVLGLGELGDRATAVTSQTEAPGDAPTAASGTAGIEGIEPH